MKDPMWLYVLGFTVGVWFGAKIERDWLIRYPEEFFRMSAKRHGK